MTPLRHAVKTFRGWLHLPDTGALYAVLGTVAANRLRRRSRLAAARRPARRRQERAPERRLAGSPDVHPAATLTEAALLSGTPKRENATDAKGGLLRAIGDFGIIVCKDFGSVLSMNRDARAAVLAALREVYDGAWTRHVGTDGGRTLAWAGKVGLVGGCTPTIDRHHAVMGAMGERFVLYRLPEVDATEQARAGARARRPRDDRCAAELADAVAAPVRADLPRAARARPTTRPTGSIALATLVVRAAAPSSATATPARSNSSPAPKRRPGSSIVLARLLAGLDAIGVDRDQRAGRSSPKPRSTRSPRSAAPSSTRSPTTTDPSTPNASPRRSATRPRPRSARSKTSPPTASAAEPLAAAARPPTPGSSPTGPDSGTPRLVIPKCRRIRETESKGLPST